MVSISGEPRDEQSRADGDDLYVTPPTVRQDIEMEEDLIEEVARLYGYDKLPVTIPKGNNEASQSYERDVKDLGQRYHVRLWGPTRYRPIPS